MERIPRTRPAGEILLATSLVVIAGVVFLRRVTGGALGDLPAAEVMLYAAIFAAVAAFVSNRLAPALPRSVPSQTPLVLGFLASLLFSAGLAADAFDAFGSLLAIAVVLAVPRLWPVLAEMPSQENGATRRIAEVSNDDTPEDPNLAQSMTLCVIGADHLVEGMLAFEIPAGETFHQLHVPFWPSLPAVPEVECEADGIDARVRVALAAPHGLRIEVRVSEPADGPQTGIVHFTAHAATSRAAA